MTKIIGFLGKKQSGKNTCSNILHGMELLKREMIQDYKIVEGKLHVLTSSSDGKIDWGEFDITRKDDQFVAWAEYNMWPYIKNYAFADYLKEMCIKLFDIPSECLYGTDKQKQSVIEHLRWENMPGFMDLDLHKACLRNHYGMGFQDFAKKCIANDSGPMTSREFMQYFGTEIVRKIYPNAWCNFTLNKIEKEKSEVSIVSDVRFLNEVQAIKKGGGIIVKLHRNRTKDLHNSEAGVDLIPNDMIDVNIKNNKKNFSIEDLQKEVAKLI